MRDAYMGIDVGTSVIKAAAFDEHGQQLAVESRPAKLDSPHEGWFEQDMDDVLAAVGAVVRGLVERTGTAPELIGLTGQGDGVWLVDERGQQTRPAISWMDARASALVQEWQRTGVVERFFRRNGGAIFPGCPAPVLAWLDANEPEALNRAETAGYCKDMVMLRLTGVRAADPSDASLPFLDPRTRTYAPDLLELSGLAHRESLLAPIADPLPIGQLTAEAADLLGVPAGTPVSAGPFDLPACARGSGVDRAGEGHLIVGTTLACQVLVDDLDTSGEPAGLTIAWHQPGRWLRAMPTMVGTSALDWVLAMIGEQHAAVDPMLAESPPGAHGVRCLPYFSPAGERAPFIETGARARFDGLTVQTTKADLVRATCEAIALAARHCFDEAGIDGDVAICGGGVRSTQWLRMFADALGRTVRVASKDELGAYGAVLAALDAFGRDVDTSSWTEPANEVQPNPDFTDHYSQNYAQYRVAVERVRAEWKERPAS